MTQCTYGLVWYRSILSKIIIKSLPFQDVYLAPKDSTKHVLMQKLHINFIYTIDIIDVSDHKTYTV